MICLRYKLRRKGIWLLFSSKEEEKFCGFNNKKNFVCLKRDLFSKMKQFFKVWWQKQEWRKKYGKLLYEYYIFHLLLLFRFPFFLISIHKCHYLLWKWYKMQMKMEISMMWKSFVIFSPLFYAYMNFFALSVWHYVDCFAVFYFPLWFLL